MLSIRHKDGQTFGGQMHETIGQDTLYSHVKVFIGKQMNVFQYQQPFRAVSHHGCSLNDNGFMLACYRGGTGDWR